MAGTTRCEVGGLLSRMVGFSLPILFSFPATLFSLPATLFSFSVSLFSLPATLFSLPATLFSFPATLFSLPTTLFSLPATLFSLPATLFSFPATLFSFPATLFSFPATLFSLVTDEAGRLTGRSDCGSVFIPCICFVCTYAEKTSSRLLAASTTGSPAWRSPSPACSRAKAWVRI